MKWLGLGGLAAAGGGAATNQALSGNRYYRGPQSDHFDGTVFFNPGGRPPAGFADLMRWQFGGGRARWLAEHPSPFEPAKPATRVEGDDLVVTMVGHATLLIQAAGLNILTDPVWSARASPFSFAGPARVVAPGIAFDDLPPIDVVLVSHNHYDHLDVATLARLHAAHDPLVITPLGNDAIIGAAVPAMRIVARDWGEAVETGTATVHVEPSHHWSARGMADRRMALWAAFVIETAAGHVYVVGDTGYHDGINYRDAASRFGGFRLAVLPIGAYEPRWFMESQHQNPDEAVRGMVLANAAHAVGHHWATFQLTNEPWGEPRERLAVALSAHGVAPERFRPMLPGEVWQVPPAATA
jgi:L-ascorbate metabolism protein UlaG (beta-lactamase superfamily)